MAERHTLRVVDAWQDLRFAGNPLVTGEPHLCAYLGLPLLDDDGQALGTLCVMDRRVRAFTAEEVQIVQHLLLR